VRSLEKILGKLDTITVLGQTYRVTEVVAVPAYDTNEELEEILLRQPVLFASWRRILARCKARYARATDECEETRCRLFRVYWDALAEREKKEREGAINGDETQPQRRSRVKAEIATGRVFYRRDFTDERVWGFVHSDKQMLESRKTVRQAKAEVEVTEAVLAGLDHRMRCLTHLAALHRDERRQ
jgi:hypothetical protein